MQQVARRYGNLLKDAHQRWEEARAQAKKAEQPLPTQLTDPDREALRQVLYAPGSPPIVPDGHLAEVEWFFGEEARVELGKLQAEIDRWIIQSKGAPPHAVILTDKSLMSNSRVFLRGNPRTKGEEAPRRYLKILSGEAQLTFQEGSGRLELARAITDRANPLTARVMANRIWARRFGRGLVTTPSDFGLRSDPPSHPALLDHLATRFAKTWSLKALHRTMIFSSTYRQSSSDRPDGQKADGANRLLWRMHRDRLDFEAMRDALLAVSGDLERRLGGRPVELTQQPFPLRRAVYGYIDRLNTPPILRIFDFPNPGLHSTGRSTTTVPQQALFFLNNPFVVERAVALAGRDAVRAARDDTQRVHRMHELVLQRRAGPEEIALALDFIRAAPTAPPDPPPSPWHYGYGRLNVTSMRVEGFTPLPFYNGTAWQGGPAWPDGQLHYLRLSRTGGHVGIDHDHAAVRRWVAPRDGLIRIEGALAHGANGENCGDGVRASVISSRSGRVGRWTVHDGEVATPVEPFEVREGDTIDFVMNMRKDHFCDVFEWAPIIHSVAPGGEEDPRLTWSAVKDFRGQHQTALDPWEMYAQVLLLSNEFLFID